MTAPRLLAILAALALLLSMTMLERERAGLAVDRLEIGETPVTLLRPAGGGPRPTVVVAHGYAGSRQMMRAISTTLARAGFAVAAFDFLGHGRHDRPMSGDVTSLEGTTAQLVAQTVALSEAVAARPDMGPVVALLGHSMATDVVVRAAEALGVDTVVAISMYSEAVTHLSPERLLILSGAQERRLRGVALDALRLVEPGAAEGVTVTEGPVERRAVAAPLVGHVGVLYAPAALRELRAWIAGGPPAGAVPPTGLWLAILLGATVALAWPTARLLGPVEPGVPPSRRTALLAILLPVAPALLAAALVPNLGGLMAFAPLGAALAAWGFVQGAVLWRAGLRPGRARALPTLLLLAWGLLFALLLDRYGAAFLPTGPRLPLAMLLLLGTLPFALAEAWLLRDAGWVLRVAARGAILATLLAAMLLRPALGVAFTVLPVLVLFWLVYGLAGRWVGRRAAPASTGLALGLALAWALAASTPLLAA
jgi:hypothetical protein